MAGLNQRWSIFEHGRIGLVLTRMPRIEERLTYCRNFIWPTKKFPESLDAVGRTRGLPSAFLLRAAARAKPLTWCDK